MHQKMIVPVYTNTTKDIFVQEIQSKRKPAVLKGVDIGECVFKWSPDYLIEKIGDLDVRIHVSSEGKLDFIQKNFAYKTLKLGDLIKRSSGCAKDNYFICPEEYYYLRSLSSERRGRETADLKIQFPQISNDVKIPNFFNDKDFFSSVLRVSSPGLQLWTHYDMMDNLLIQVQGRKRVVLFSPSDVKFLYLSGDKSQVLDIDNPDLVSFPNFAMATHYECILEEGDILYIPALWFHNTLALTYGVAVNVFWKNLKHEYYDKSDFYGNKDLIPAAKALQSVQNALKLLDDLPSDYRDFYMKRAAITIENHVNKI